MLIFGKTSSSKITQEIVRLSFFLHVHSLGYHYFLIRWIGSTQLEATHGELICLYSRYVGEVA